ncbi:MAG: PUA domain-containing protein [Candidatus Thermoplasmatota archaeon]
MLRLRNRQRLRRKEVADLAVSLEGNFGCAVFPPDEAVETAEAGALTVVLVRGTALGLLAGGRPSLSVRGAIEYRPTRRFVTVDMGAVKFVYNGADVMAPGIVDADPSIAVGDLVWVRDERNRQPLAVGEALMTGADMNAAEKGKAVRSLHHVGDEVWKLDESP